MSEQENTKVVQRGYESFKSGDIQGLLDLFSEDIQWHLPKMENVPFAGKRQGREQVKQFFASLADAQEVKQFELREVIAQGDKVVALGHYIWRVKSTGREFAADWAHVWTVRDGKLTRLHEYTDTAAAVSAYQKAQSA
ncbi:MAG TPA: nuclear transport factor 2 family protein [Pyrinomonadaceae bacterium]|nr:nuclear transport factor 2 family protein [Pyrinomonadaceae bacterium]